MTFDFIEETDKDSEEDGSHFVCQQIVHYRRIWEHE